MKVKDIRTFEEVPLGFARKCFVFEEKFIYGQQCGQQTKTMVFELFIGIRGRKLWIVIWSVTYKFVV